MSKKNAPLIDNRRQVAYKVLYRYFVYSSLFMFLWLCSIPFTGLGWFVAFIPVALLILFATGVIVHKNISRIWMFITDRRRGKLMLRMNEIIKDDEEDYVRVHWSETHKNQLIRWVYPHHNEIRKEDRSIITNKLLDNKRGDTINLSKDEKIKLQRGVVSCPLELTMGFNKALLVDLLIWSHINIKTLDKSIRDTMELTDDNMNRFSLQGEIDKCKN